MKKRRGAKPLKRNEYRSRERLAATLAEKVSDALGKTLTAKSEAMLAVSGGSTPAQFFKALSACDLDWEKVTVTLVDERFLAPANPRSNMGMVTRLLLQDQAAAAKFLPLYAGEETSLDDAADAADVAFSKAGSPDVCILGMGTDGHTASFFPGGDNLATATDPECQRRVVSMNAEGAGEARLTLTLPVLLKADFLALHIEGADKRSVLEKAQQEGPISHMPIRSVLRNADDRLQLFWAP